MTTPFKTVTHTQPGTPLYSAFLSVFIQSTHPSVIVCDLFVKTLCMDYLLPLEGKLHEGRNVCFARWYISWR